MLLAFWVRLLREGANDIFNVLPVGLSGLTLDGLLEFGHGVLCLGDLTRGPKGFVSLVNEALDLMREQRKFA